MKLELLSPAKDLECGIAAIDCGADAVYIGASNFGARNAAGNSLSDIEKLVQYAHPFRSKVYVALNTILYDDELEEAGMLAHSVYQAGADALIIQDMGLLEMDLPPIPLFASTQANNRDVKKVKFLEKVGFQRAILARELSLPQIEEIRKNTQLELEFFVHGALCVSYSGQCYFSQAVCGRSGNRGECAQPCRMSYSLQDQSGKILAKDKFPLSLKDLNLSGQLSELIDAGISSFKIEGRLKDAFYVKNITSYYRQKLDAILENSPHRKASSGKSFISFIPNPEKTFHRGSTEYFLKGRSGDMASWNTQKSIGEQIGIIKHVDLYYFTLEDKNSPLLASGDGVCFFNPDQELCGMKIDHVEGEKIFPNDNRWIASGMTIYRNFNQKFNRELKGAKIERRIKLEMEFSETDNAFLLKAKDEDGYAGSFSLETEKIVARNPDQAWKSIEKQLGSLGETRFYCEKLDIRLSKPYFIPLSLLNRMRREVTGNIEKKRESDDQRNTVSIQPNDYPYPEKILDFSANVLNQKAEAFYQRHGAEVKERALENGISVSGKKILTAKYCILYEMGNCKKLKSPSDRIKEPLYIIDRNKEYSVFFNCEQCEMEIYFDI
jgi:putative protease